MRFYYYNLNHKVEDGFLNGRLVSLDEILNDFRLKNKELISKNSNTFSSLEIEKVDPLIEKNKEEWIKMFSTIVYILTGCIPDTTEKNYIKKTYFDLKQYSRNSPKIKKLLDSKLFVFICLPYIVSGFHINNPGWSLNGNNNLNNLFSFLENLIESEASVSTFFCAHREKIPELVRDLDYNSISISCNLILGIVKNISEDHVKKDGLLKIYQPDASIHGISSIFPEIFLNYTNKGEIGELVIGAKEHFDNLSKYLSEKYEGDAILLNLDNHRKDVIERCNKLFGNDFMGIKNLPLESSKSESEEDLYYIIEDAQDKILRLMPFYVDGIAIDDSLINENISNSKKYTNKMKNIQEIVSGSIYDFFKIKSATGKAIYETIFYVMWGERAKKKKEVIVGLERDHNLYQTRGISYGYKMGHLSNATQYFVPLLFAKREPKNELLKLSKLSFRQFFRLSEKGN